MKQQKLLELLTSCEILLDKSNGGTVGEVALVQGIMALELFDEIERVHGKLWTAHTSRDELEKARKLSAEHPTKALWNAYFTRELILSAMGGLDTGRFHTRHTEGK